MAATFTSAVNALKETYEEPLRDILNHNCFISEQIDKNTTRFSGKRAVHAIRTRGTGAVGARGTGGTLPSAGSQGYSQALIPIRRNYAVGNVDRALWKASQSDRGAFVDALKDEMDGLSRSGHTDVNRQYWGTSDGVIAVCGTTSNSTTVVLDSTTTTTQMLQIIGNAGTDARVDIGTVASPATIASGRTVSSYDLVNKTITISGAAVTTTSSHRIFRAGSGGTSDDSGLPDDGQLEVTGLQHIVDSSGVLHTIDPSSVPGWVADKETSVGAISENKIEKRIQEAEVLSGSQVNLLVSNRGVHRAIVSVLRQRQRQLDTVELRGGYKGVRFSAAGEFGTGGQELALYWEKDCPEGELFGLSTDALVEHVLTDWEFVDEDGNVLDRTSTDNFEFRLAKYHELATHKRNAHFRMTGIVEA